MYTSAEVAYKNKETNFASDGSNYFFEKKNNKEVSHQITFNKSGMLH